MHKGNSIDIPFVVTAPDGTVDTTTVASVTAASTTVAVGIRPDNNRVAFVDGKAENATGANVVISATEGGVQFSDSFLVEVQPAQNLGSVKAGTTASAEYPTPATR